MRIFLSLLFLLISQLSFARVDDYYKETEIIKNIINESLEKYQDGKNLEASKLVGNAYFQHFENMEGTIGRNVGRKVITMERKFSNLRKYYKNNVELTKIKALIDSLFYDLDEVTPIIQHGFRLEAEASDTTYDKKAAEESSVRENAKREAAAEDIFNQILGGSNTPKEDNSNLKEPAKISQKENISKQDDIKENNTDKDLDKNQEEIQSASSLSEKLQSFYDDITLKLDESISFFKAGKIEEAKKLITSVQFDDYRNSKLEVAVNKYTKPGLDQKIQQALRKFSKRITESDVKEGELRKSVESIKEDLYDAMILIPENKISEIRVEGFEKQADNSKDYRKVADDIKIATDNILKNYQNKGTAAIIDEIQTTYFDLFEATGMENKIGAVDNSLKLKIESKFTQSVALVKGNSSKEELAKCFDELNAMIAGVLDKIEDSSPFFLFIAAFGILLREGLEALIIVVAIVSYLIQSGNKNRLSIAYSALWTGIFLSFVTAFVIYYLFREYAGQFRELLEGVTFLLAVILLLYVGFWLLHNASDKKWASHLKTQAADAISKNSAKTLWITVFLAVYREGAETVLFYQALLFDAKSGIDFSAIFGGLLLATLILVVLYFLLKAGAIRIPIKLFFSITSFIIFYMCVVFTGKGVAELAEGKLITPTLISDGMKFDPISWLGLYPYYETIIPQIIVLLLIFFGVILTKMITSNREGEKR